MAFDLHIKNIGKLADAKLRIERFTVLAGPNNTGKSFVSKILYSFFNSMNANHLAVHLRSLTKPVWGNLRRLHVDSKARADTSIEAMPSIEAMVVRIRQMKDLVEHYRSDDFVEFDRTIEKLNYITAELLELYGTAEESLALFTGTPAFAELGESLGALQKGLAGMTALQLIVDGLEHMVRKNLLGNFQASNFAELRGNEKHESKLVIDDLCALKVLSEDFEFDISYDWLLIFQQYSKVIFLDSPMLWKLKSTLEDLRLSDWHRPHAGRERITGIPEYFYDLGSALRRKYIDEMDFPELHAKLTGKDVLGGKLVISDTGEILFREKNRSFPLSVTATGVINLGILALLIERKVLDKESFIFIDEPEAHLHPAWQVVMAESLFELAKGGAHVVIATHSIDILKWLEVHAKKNPQDKELIALNQFPAQNGEGDAQDFDEKMASILQELTDPFAKNFMRGV